VGGGPPARAQTGLLLAQADGPDQRAAVGHQAAGRVGFFLRVDDFAAACEKMIAAGVEFLTEPRTEPYGRVAVFRDIAGNRWDLLGPPPTPQASLLWAEFLFPAEFWSDTARPANSARKRQGTLAAAAPPARPHADGGTA